VNREAYKSPDSDNHHLALVEAKRLLFDLDYVPELPNRDRAMGALNNFPALMLSDYYGQRRETLAGMGGSLDEPRELLDGRSAGELFDDVDKVIAEQAEKGDITREEIDSWVGSTDDDYNDENMLTFFQKCYPIFEKLVTDFGYNPKLLIR
jgi:hypothetical protein